MLGRVDIPQQVGEDGINNVLLYCGNSWWLFSFNVDMLTRRTLDTCVT